MQEMFGGIYEDDGPDETPENDVKPSDGEGDEEYEDNEDGESSGGGGEFGDEQDDESKFQAKIFILPMKHLDKAFDRNSNY